MKDRKDTQPSTEYKSYFEKLEIASSTQVSHSIIAQIILKLKKKRNSGINT